ncbi:glycosyltransferase family 2 protein [Spirosoma sp. RP8]|uniref:Glycosyltransferase family 2 protein n=1 Tax=Spirosoma liriopis TaxID=2937440 RepID=A0ABT0HJG7_9BACT|nr:glycosyltransferase family A protein [Spirosoma liriopis]MCK8492304.1 glycosyltransferase family 2 protein [Spirosoma liriopis]
MVSVIIPTYNAADYIPVLLKSIRQQTLTHELIIIDSESNDETRTLLTENGIPVVTIPKEDFNHGTTRNYGVSIAKYDIVIFLTQDALPARPDAFERLVEALTVREDIAIAYGRQLPYPDADVLSQFARTSNYPNQSVIKSKVDIPRMGIKTCHCSNSFAAYRKKDFLDVGGFPSDTILGEDVSVAARLILDGKAVAYTAEAEVFHSHNYTLTEEFKRYFDIGAFHKQQQKVLQPFTKAEAEGLKYVINEWTYLKKTKNLKLIPKQLIRTAAKYVGYRVGYWHEVLPISFKRIISMHRSFWK